MESGFIELGQTLPRENVWYLALYNLHSSSHAVIAFFLQESSPRTVQQLPRKTKTWSFFAFLARCVSVCVCVSALLYCVRNVAPGNSQEYPLSCLVRVYQQPRRTNPHKAGMLFFELDFANLIELIPSPRLSFEDGCLLLGYLHFCRRQAAPTAAY